MTASSLTRGVRRFPLIPDGNRFPASRSRLSARDMSAIRIGFSRNACSGRPGPLPHRGGAMGVVSRRIPRPSGIRMRCPRGDVRVGSSAPLAPPKRAQDRIPRFSLRTGLVTGVTRPVAVACTLACACVAAMDGRVASGVRAQRATFTETAPRRSLPPEVRVAPEGAARTPSVVFDSALLRGPSRAGLSTLAADERREVVRGVASPRRVWRIPISYRGDVRRRLPG